MAIAKKAVDSTIKRLLIHTAEILLSIVILIEICLPILFVAPMWIEQIVFGTPTESTIYNPVAWFGLNATLTIVLALTLVSLLMGYGTVTMMGRPEKEDKKETSGTAEEDLSEEETE